MNHIIEFTQASGRQQLENFYNHTQSSSNTQPFPFPYPPGKNTNRDKHD